MQPLACPRSARALARCPSLTVPLCFAEQHRRSQLELFEQLNTLFDSLDSPSPTSPLLSPDAASPAPTTPRTAPLRLLPDLLTAFETKRGVHILDADLRATLLAQIAALPPGMEDQPVGVEQVLQLLVGLGATSEPTPAPHGDSAQPAAQGLRVPTPSRGATDEGSPRPRNRRVPSTSPGSTSASASAAGISLLCSPSNATSTGPAPRRRSLLASLSRSPHGDTTTPSSSGGGRTLRRRATFEDLAALVQAQSGTYLGAGVGADGPLGEGWSAEELAGSARKAMSGKGPVRLVP